MRSFLKLAFQKDTLITGFKLSLIVGIILNLINQGVEICTLDYQHIHYLKLILTFLVPFLVSIYSSAFTKKTMERLNNKD